jgi:hypothetical protein
MVHIGASDDKLRNVWSKCKNKSLACAAIAIIIVAILVIIFELTTNTWGWFWSGFCSTRCGDGTVRYKRQCIPGSIGGKACEGNDIRVDTCTRGACVDYGSETTTAPTTTTTTAPTTTTTTAPTTTTTTAPTTTTTTASINTIVQNAVTNPDYAIDKKLAFRQMSGPHSGKYLFVTSIATVSATPGYMNLIKRRTHSNLGGITTYFIRTNGTSNILTGHLNVGVMVDQNYDWNSLMWGLEPVNASAGQYIIYGVWRKYNGDTIQKATSYMIPLSTSVVGFGTRTAALAAPWTITFA